MDRTLRVFARGAKEGAYPEANPRSQRNAGGYSDSVCGHWARARKVTHHTHYDLVAHKSTRYEHLVRSGLGTGFVNQKILFLSSFQASTKVSLCGTLWNIHQAFLHTASINIYLQIPHEGWDAWRHKIRQASQTQQIRPAGVKAEYSDVGFILLGAALEAIYSQPLSTFALLGTQLFFVTDADHQLYHFFLFCVGRRK